MPFWCERDQPLPSGVVGNTKPTLSSASTLWAGWPSAPVDDDGAVPEGAVPAAALPAGAAPAEPEEDAAAPEEDAAVPEEDAFVPAAGDAERDADDAEPEDEEPDGAAASWLLPLAAPSVCAGAFALPACAEEVPAAGAWAAPSAAGSATAAPANTSINAAASGAVLHRRASFMRLAPKVVHLPPAGPPQPQNGKKSKC